MANFLKYLYLLLKKNQRSKKIINSINKEFLGSVYGGWTIYPDNLSEISIVYSFGVGEDASFDIEILKKYGVEVFAFDPTPKSINWVNNQNFPKNFHFYPFGLGSKDEIVSLYPPENPEFISHTILPGVYSRNGKINVQMYRLSTIIQMLGHQKIDLLKMDIEGAEYAVIDDLLLSEDLNINQLLIEFHHFFPGISKGKTNSYIRKLQKHGYKLFNISRNGYEFSFIKS